MRNERPRTQNELKDYVAGFFDIDIPDTQVCPDHSTPFRFLSDIFFELHGLILGIANRNGFKTLTMAIADVLDLHFKGAGIIHAGAIEQQANKGYEYVRNFLISTYADKVAGVPMMSKTRMKDGGHIEVFPITLNKMAGPHEAKLRRDETDLARPDALKQSAGIPTSQKGPGGERVKISVVDVSTRYYSYGNVQEMMDKAESEHRKIHLWCYKETTEQCPDSRSGTTPTKVYVDRIALHSVTPAEYNGFTKSEQGDYEAFNVLDGCLSCALLPSCRADLKRAGGIQPIEDLLVAWNDTSAETWISQRECQKPMNLGVIFRSEWKARYHRLKEFKLPSAEARKKQGLTLYRCLDFGLLRPSVGWILHYPEPWIQDVQFIEHEPKDKTIDQVKQEIMKIDAELGLTDEDFVATWVDPAGRQRSDIDKATRIRHLQGDRDAKEDYQRYDCKPRIPVNLNVWTGIDTIKSRLKITDGRPLFTVVEANCPQTIRAFETYHKRRHGPTGLWLNQPEDPQEYEHPMDRLRYYFVGMYGRVALGARVYEN